MGFSSWDTDPMARIIGWFETAGVPHGVKVVMSGSSDLVMVRSQLAPTKHLRTVKHVKVIKHQEHTLVFVACWEAQATRLELPRWVMGALLLRQDLHRLLQPLISAVRISSKMSVKVMVMLWISLALGARYSMLALR